MTARLALTAKCHANIISIYAPTLKRTMEEKAQFYDQLDEALSEIPKCDCTFLVGEFNASVGSDAQMWPEILGIHGLGVPSKVRCCCNFVPISVLLLPTLCSNILTSIKARRPHHCQPTLQVRHHRLPCQENC